MPKSTLVPLRDLQTEVDPLLALTTMTASGCLPCQERQRQEVHTSAATPPSAAVFDLAPEVETPPSGNWSGTIGVEGELTGDGRLIEANALRWENLPLPLRYVSNDVGSHDGAQVVGQITKLSRGPKGAILGEGTFDTGSAVGLEAMRQVEQGLTNGVSMDLDDVSFEVRIAQDVMEGDGMGFPLFLAAEPGNPPADPNAGPEVDSEGRVTVMEINATDEVRVTTDGRIRAATIVAIPAFASAKIELAAATTPPPPPPGKAAPAGLLPDGKTPCSCTEGDPDFDPNCDCSAPAAKNPPPPPPAKKASIDPDAVATGILALLASAPPLEPPVAWFQDPKFKDYTPLTVTKDGRVYGHIAEWGTCHVSHAQNGQCIMPPHSSSGYMRFHYGALLTAEGSEIAVGHLTMDTRHAGGKLSPAATLSHYEDTGTVIADVRAGEDNWGIWVSGALRPDATPNQVRALRSAPISGDWRRYGTDLELVAALAVNVPGFGVPRPQGLVAGGAVVSLVAAGMLPPRKVLPPGAEGALSVDDLRYLKRLVQRERQEEAIRAGGGSLPSATDLARRVRASQLAMRVRHPHVTVPIQV